MRNRRTLMFTSPIVFALIAVVLGAMAYGQQQRAASKLKAATETAHTTAIRETADTALTSKPDVTVNGQHIDIPVNGITSKDVSGGGHVNVTTNHGLSNTSSGSPDGSVHVSITSSSGNASSSLDAQVQSDSSVQSSDWSQVNVFASGTNSVEVHN